MICAVIVLCQLKFTALPKVVFEGRNQYDEIRCRQYSLTVFPIGARG
jgi:hypothetical protein